MQKTVICHFYNEEFLLPWWLKHHNAVFDHGIMIDYASTDRSVEIIKELCPNWEIRPSRNQYFDSDPIDAEVMDIEAELTGWRMALNVTEFLYGNTDHLADIAEPTQYLIGNYVFVDMEDETKGPLGLDHSLPLHQQRYWGHDDFANNGVSRGAIMGRLNRSVHNHTVKYTGGRHWPYSEQSFKDLVIFYYGWADIGETGLNRKTQILGKINENATVHHHSREAFINEYRNAQQPVSKDLREEIAPILEHNQRITGQDW